MSEATTDGSTVDSNASGEAGAAKDSVSYDSYSKLLNQRKADKLKADALEAKLKELEQSIASKQEEELKEQNKFKELYEKSVKEKEELSQKFMGLNESIVRAEKIHAFEQAAGAQLKHEAFYSHINLDGIQRDDSGDIDMDSLNAVVGEFKNTFGESLFNINTAKTLPSGSPKGVAPKGLDALTAAEIKAKLLELGQ